MSVKIRCAYSIVHLLKNIAECVVSTHLKEVRARNAKY